MLQPSRGVMLSCGIKRLFHGINMSNYSNEQKNRAIKNTIYFDPEQKMLDFTNSSIKPYVNTDKVQLLNKFYYTRNELTCTYNFLINEGVAQDIVKEVLCKGHKKEQIIVEGNPGLGLITLNLINSGVPHLIVFDQSEAQDVCLTQLLASHGERITKKAGNMHKNPDCILLNSVDFSQQYGLPVTIIGVATSLYFLRGLVINFLKYDLFQKNLSVFLVLGNSTRNCLTTERGQRDFKFPIYAMFHLMFRTEEIAKYPREAFLPWCKDNVESMSLIRLVINPDCFNTITKEEYKDYFIFLKILGTSLKNFVIPTLEKWLPDCGPYLISKGISMTFQVSDLTHQEALLLFKFFTECEGYEDFKVHSRETFSKNSEYILKH